MISTTSARALFGAGLAAFVCFSSSSAKAAVLTEICIRTSDFDDAGTDDNLYVTLVGVSGETTRKFNFDTPGVDDMVRGRWSCFLGRDDIGSGAILDVGFHIKVNLSFSGGDDFCMRQMYTRRWQDRKTPEDDLSTLLSTSQFWNPARDKRVCFGNDSSLGSIWEKSFITRSYPPKGESLKVSGDWIFVDGHSGPKQTFNLTESFTKSRSVTDTSAWSLAIERGFEVETGIATNSLKVTATVEESTAITNTSEVTAARGFTKDCYSTDGKSANLAMWQWSVSIPSRFGENDSVLNTTSTVCTVNHVGNGPACRPGCFDLVKDPSGNTCLQTSDACKIRLR